MLFLTWLFLPLKNVTHYNHYLTEVVAPHNHNYKTDETFAMLRRNTLRQRHKRREPSGKQHRKCVLQQNCHLMAVHSIDLRTEQFLTAYFILHFSTMQNCFKWTRQRISICRDAACSTTFRSGQETLQVKCSGFERLFENIMLSSNQHLHNHHCCHISFAVRTASSLTIWLSALCYRK